MKSTKLLGVGLTLLALAFAGGCTKKEGPGKGGGKAGAAKHEEGHVHGDGPHGGTIADWGGGKYHVEFCMDHEKKQATVYILGSDEKKPVPIKADKLLLTIKQPSFQIELKPMAQEKDPKETSSRFVGTHDNFGVEQEFAGTISGEVDGKPYTGDFKEEPETPAKK